MSETSANKTPTWIITTLVSILLGCGLAWAGSQGLGGEDKLATYALCVAAAFIINWVAFVPSFLAHTEHYFDLTGSLTYLTVTALAVTLSSDHDLRSLLAAIMVAVWAARLGTFLYTRVKKAGKDGRFDEMKHDFWQFLMTWTLQGLWVSLTLAAALAIITSPNRSTFGFVGMVGLAVWAIGFGIEIVADSQKSRFKADPANSGKYISSGLWAWSRHPNYFGEITLWTGMAIMSIPILEGWRWVALISPVFVFLLLTKVSGIPLLEKRAQERWGDDPQFQQYKNSTPALILLPPKKADA